MTVLPDPSDRNGFFSTVRGKLITALTIIALVLGIAAEGVSLYRNVMETHTSTEVSINSELRQKADAEKAKAESCSARMKYMVESSTLEELQHPGKKWDDLNRECDPSYAARAEECDKDFDAILADFEKAHNDEEAKPTIERMKEHTHRCVITEQQRKRVAAIKEKVDKNVADNNRKMEALEILKVKVGIQQEQEAGHYDKAFELSKQFVALCDAWDKKYPDKPMPFKQGAITALSFVALFVHDYDTALAAADRAISLDHNVLQPFTNRAHALMFLGRVDEAKALYFAHKGEKIGDHDWNYYIADDFKQFRAAGFSHPLMNDIERELGLQAAAVATEPKKAIP